MTGDWDAGAASHRASRGIRRELDRHPTVVTAEGFPATLHSEVVVELSPSRVDAAVAATEPTLTIRWFAGERPAASQEFSFHYSDRHGDFGWHHVSNPHVDGRDHYHERLDEGAYTYTPHEFDSTQPTRVVWVVASLVGNRLAT